MLPYCESEACLKYNAGHLSRENKLLSDWRATKRAFRSSMEKLSKMFIFQVVAVHQLCSLYRCLLSLLLEGEHPCIGDCINKWGFQKEQNRQASRINGTSIQTRDWWNDQRLNLTRQDCIMNLTKYWIVESTKWLRPNAGSKYHWLDQTLDHWLHQILDHWLGQLLI